MTSENGNYKKMKEMFHSIEGVELKERKGRTFHFPFYYSEKMEEVGIEALELSVRSYNGLKRGGYESIGKLARDIAGGVDIRRIRNCGSKSYAEIMEKLFLYNLLSMKPDRRAEYLVNIAKERASDIAT